MLMGDTVQRTVKSPADSKTDTLYADFFVLRVDGGRKEYDLVDSSSVMDSMQRTFEACGSAPLRTLSLTPELHRFVRRRRAELINREIVFNLLVRQKVDQRAGLLSLPHLGIFAIHTR